MGRVQNKTVIVTGAASGIGLEVARRMADEGANVVVADLRADMAESVAQEIGDMAHAISLDVCEDESWRHLMARTLDHFGRIDVLVNNAGIAKTDNIQNIDMISLKDWRAVQSVNVEGVLLGCQHAIRAMKMVGGRTISQTLEQYLFPYLMQTDLQAIPVNDLPPYGFANELSRKRISRGPDEGCGQGSHT